MAQQGVLLGQGGGAGPDRQSVLEPARRAADVEVNPGPLGVVEDHRRFGQSAAVQQRRDLSEAFAP